MNEAGMEPHGVVEQWKSELESTRAKLVQAIRDEVSSRGFPRVALGLSGGLDSTVAAHLCVEALGPDNVLGVLMPMRTTDPISISITQGVVNALGITSRRVNMSPSLDAYFANFPDANRNRRGLALGWTRVGALHDLGNHYGACVVQAVNRSDLLLAYGEAQQELVATLKPLRDLFKSQVQLLGDHLQILADARKRRPSLEYWPGQNDESDLGFPYDVIDPLLEGYTRRGWDASQATRRGFSSSAVEWVEKKLARRRPEGALAGASAEPRPAA